MSSFAPSAVERCAMACGRHPRAAVHRGFCAACLLEGAMVDRPQERTAEAKPLTLQVPLGETPSTCVFLVKSEGPPARLLRLKIWRRQADPGFLARFHRLQQELDVWASHDVDRPIAARLDATGCPSVLTEFSRGVPILDRVRSGRLASHEAIARLAPLIALAGRAHKRGLAHGSIVAGNVIIDPDSGRARLLDFGLTPLMSAKEERVALASADLAGFAALTQTLRTALIPSDSTRGL